MDTTVEFIKAWSALPIGATLTILLVMLVRLVTKIVTNHMFHIQKDTEVIKDGINELKNGSVMTNAHLSTQTDLLRQIANK